MKKIIAANWKMNKTIAEAEEFCKCVKEITFGKEVIIFPSFVAIDTCANILAKTDIAIGGQNLYFEEKGAYTGETSAKMLKSAGCSYALIGHSERRHVFGEKNDLLNKKAKQAILHNLMVVYCVGETKDERTSGATFKVLEDQLKNGLLDVDISKVVVAYEPVWAIGTGEHASTALAKEAHAFIKKWCMENLGLSVKVLYGGSVNTDNFEEFLGVDEIDGLLVGGASLVIEKFEKMIT